MRSASPASTPAASLSKSAVERRREEEADGLQANPFQHVKKPRSEGRRRITPLTRQEVDLLAQTAEETLGDYGRDVYAPLIVTAAWTGLVPPSCSRSSGATSTARS
jgi:hypothetical protein